MAAKTEKKLFVGQRLRRLRRELGLTQARMADELGVSASYLNLIERNQRPLSAQIILRLAEVYDFDMRALAGDQEAKAFADLMEVFGDPVFRGAPIAKQDIQELAAASPAAAEAILSLYRAYRDATMQSANLSERFADRDKVALFEGPSAPVEEVREFIHEARNYFPALDEAAEALSTELALGEGDTYGALARRLREHHNIATRIVPSDVLVETLRYFDRHRRRIMLSELLPQSGRVFQMAYQLGFLECSALIDQTVGESGLTRPETQRLARISLANYFAAALLMPYGRFLKSAEDALYDIELLGHRFGTSFEQICHRLTTLQRPGARGVPFFFIRIDNAGNVSKRFSASRFHFSKFGGTCPLWNIHDTFQTPGKIFTQIVQLPDDTAYFSIARTVKRAGGAHHLPSQQLAIGLGCALSNARQLAYAKGYDLDNPKVTPIGINCHLCERPNCSQRAFPPLNRSLVVDERARGISPFRFELGN